MQMIRFALILSLLMPARALSQEVLGFSFGGGFTLTAGDESDTYGIGPTFSVRTLLPLSDRLGLQVAVGYHEIRIKEEVAVRRAEIVPSEFRPGGGFVEGGNQRSLGILVEGAFHLLPRSGRLSPYLLAGAGASQVRVTDLNVWHVGRWKIREPGDSELVLGADAGGGLQVRFSPVVSAFVQGTYQALFTDGGSTTMVPIQIGLLFELSR
jgi:hypothetical protein